MTTIEKDPAMLPAASFAPACIGLIHDPDDHRHIMQCADPAVALVDTVDVWGNVRVGGCCAMHLERLRKGAQTEDGAPVVLRGVREIAPELTE